MRGSPEVDCRAGDWRRLSVRGGVGRRRCCARSSSRRWARGGWRTSTRPARSRRGIGRTSATARGCGWSDRGIRRARRGARMCCCGAARSRWWWSIRRRWSREGWPFA